MGRPRLHDDDDVLDAARGLVIHSGLSAATVSAIARSSGAPTGSLYHRFASRDAILAATWIRAARRSQARFFGAMDGHAAREAAVAAALSILDFCREHLDDARLLVAFRRADLLASAPAASRAELATLNQPAEAAFRDLAKRLWGRARAGDLEVLVLATVDLPLGAVRRHLIAGAMPPASIRAPLEAAVRAALRMVKAT